jgi:Ala-tRNA(Pro) deacylase
MSMPPRLQSHLSEHQIAYGRVFHPAIHSAQRTAAMMHFPGIEVAKTIALRTGHQPFLAVLPATHRINFERMRDIVGERVHLLDDVECREMFPDCESGAIPPFGELYGLPVYLDQRLVANPQIVFCAGTLSEGVRMGNVEFMHLVKPKVGDFAEKPQG